MTEEVLNDDVEVKEDNVENVDAQEDTEKTFTQKELDAIVTKRVQRAIEKERKDSKAKLDEAEKLRKMNAEQKAQYEKEKSDREIADLKSQLNRKNLEKEATNLLQKQGILVDDDVLDFVVKDTAEDTDKAISVFVSLVDNAVNYKLKELSKGKEPIKKAGSTINSLSKEDILKMSYFDRLEFKNTNPEEYKRILG